MPVTQQNLYENLSEFNFFCVCGIDKKKSNGNIVKLQYVQLQKTNLFVI